MDTIEMVINQRIQSINEKNFQLFKSCYHPFISENNVRCYYGYQVNTFSLKQMALKWFEEKNVRSTADVKFVRAMLGNDKYDSECFNELFVYDNDWHIDNMQVSVRKIAKNENWQEYNTLFSDVKVVFDPEIRLLESEINQILKFIDKTLNETITKLSMDKDPCQKLLVGRFYIISGGLADICLPKGIAGQAFEKTIILKHDFGKFVFSNLQHEIIHFIAFLIGYPTHWIMEGLAEAFTMTGLARTNSIGLIGVEKYYSWDYFTTGSDHRKIAASFVTYLIDNYGIDKFKKLYSSVEIIMDNEQKQFTHQNNIFKEVYGKPLIGKISEENLQEEWKIWLKNR